MNNELLKLKAKGLQELGNLYSLVPFGKERIYPGTCHQYIAALEAKIKALESQSESVFLVWESEWQEDKIVLNVWATKGDAIAEMEALKKEDTDQNSNFYIDERPVRRNLPPTESTAGQELGA